jgi:hypothetical protein
VYTTVLLTGFVLLLEIRELKTIAPTRMPRNTVWTESHFLDRLSFCGGNSSTSTAALSTSTAALSTNGLCVYTTVLLTGFVLVLEIRELKTIAPTPMPRKTVWTESLLLD